MTEKQKEQRYQHMKRLFIDALQTQIRRKNYAGITRAGRKLHELQLQYGKKS